MDVQCSIYVDNQEIILITGVTILLCFVFCIDFVIKDLKICLVIEDERYS